MGIRIWKIHFIRLFICTLAILLGYLAFLSIIDYSSKDASAHTDTGFGPACGRATLDGNVDPDEWSSASTQTFQMESPGSIEPFTATLYVMNSGNNLYMGITINDDEFTQAGTWLPHGDVFRIDFDNDHSGSLFAFNDDVLSIAAGSPQFQDNYIIATATSSSNPDVNGGGTSDGFGVASRVGDLNHFELRHPICSGDTLDFCLQPSDTVGFRLEYLDAQANGEFGGSRFFPGHDKTSIADLLIGNCPIPELLIYLPIIQK